MDSILIWLRKMLGIEENDNHFDPDIVTHANTAFMVLNQLGVGPAEGFWLEPFDTSTTWDIFLGDKKNVQGVKTYLYLKVRLPFDPPTNSFLIEAMERQIKELECRILIQVDPPVVTPTDEEVITDGY